MEIKKALDCFENAGEVDKECYLSFYNMGTLYKEHSYFTGIIMTPFLTGSKVWSPNFCTKFDYQNDFSGRRSLYCFTAEECKNLRVFDFLISEQKYV